MSASGNLLYISRPIDNTVDVYSYPKGKKVGEIGLSAAPFGLCSDAKGNVWVTMYGQINEYSHGGTQPISSIEDGTLYAVACSVDLKTGDLAVANEDGPSTEYGNLTVYKSASKPPVTYTNPQFIKYSSCAYDASGDLYVTGYGTAGTFVFAGLRAGAGSLEVIALSHTPQGAASVQWDGQYVAVSSPDEGAILRFTFSGRRGQEQGSTSLEKFAKVVQFSFPIAPTRKSKTAHRVIGSDNQYGATRFWRYPQGGVRTKQIPGNGVQAFGSAVSFAPK